MLILFVFFASLASCYKDECHMCTTQVTRNGIIQPNEVQQTYCGLTKKEIRGKETSAERTYYDSAQGKNVYELELTHCDVQ